MRPRRFPQAFRYQVKSSSRSSPSHSFADSTLVIGTAGAVSTQDPSSVASKLGRGLTGDSEVGLFTGTITVILSCKIVFSRSFQHCSVTVGQGRQIFVLIPTDASSIGTRFEDAFLVDVTGAPFHTLVVGQFIKTISNNLANPGLYYRCPVPHSSCGTIHQNNLKQSFGCSQAVEQSSTIHDCFPNNL